MAEKRKGPSLEELNEAIAREHGIDPASLKDYRLPERAVDPEAHRAVEAAIHLPALEEELRRPNPLQIIRQDLAEATNQARGIGERAEALYEGPPLPLSGILDDGELLTARAGAYMGQAREEMPAPNPKVVPFTSKGKSCFGWTPLQMLKEFVRAIEAGEETPAGMVIVYAEETPDHGQRILSWRAQLGWTEEYTFLEVAQHNCLDSQRR